jgi:hypothetical protein
LKLAFSRMTRQEATPSNISHVQTSHYNSWFDRGFHRHIWNHLDFVAHISYAD